MSASQPTAMKRRGNLVYLRIENKDEETIFEILQKEDLKSIDSNGNTLLHLLFKNKHLVLKKILEVLEMLLDQGLDPNVKNNDELTVLHLAVEKRMKNAVDLLINRGAKIDVCDKKGNSIAHFFVESEHRTYMESMEHESAIFAEWLISKGFNFDRRNNCRHSQSALHLAIDRNLQHILPTLLRHSADVNFVAKRRNKNLLHFFLEANELYRRQTYVVKYSRRYAVDIVQILIEKGVSVDTVSADGKTPLDLALQTYDETDVIETIVDRFTNVHHKNEFGQTSFHQILANLRLNSDSKDYLKMIRCLIERGSDVDSPDNSGTRPIHLVLKNTRYVEQLLDLLVSAGCDVNAKDADGETALRLAVLDTKICVAQKLIELGADVNCLETRETMTSPLQIAAKRQYPKLMKLLLDGGAEIDWKDSRLGETALHMAVKWDRIDNVQLLLQRGADMHASNNDGQTALHLAIVKSNVFVVQKFIDQGVDVNLPMPNCGTTTPFLLAIAYGHLEVVELLLKNGANVNYEDPISGDRPLHVAVTYKRDLQTVVNVELLLKHGAHVNALNKKGESALVLGMRFCRCDVVEMLLEYGADIIGDPRKIVKSSIQFFSCVYSSWNVVNLLLEHLIKLEVANIFRSKNCEFYTKQNQYNSYYERCSAEVEKLKRTLINSHNSLYHFLNMQPSNRCIHINNEKLKKLVDSPKLKEQFPVYATVILANYRQAVVRKPLLEPAKEAWNWLTEIFLPDLCIERILDYLGFEDLISMIQNKI